MGGEELWEKKGREEREKKRQKLMIQVNHSTWKVFNSERIFLYTLYFRIESRWKV